MKYGARPLRRMVQSEIEDKLAEEILTGKVKSGDTVSVTIKDDKIMFKAVESHKGGKNGSRAHQK